VVRAAARHVRSYEGRGETSDGEINREGAAAPKGGARFFDMTRDSLGTNCWHSFVSVQPYRVKSLFWLVRAGRLELPRPLGQQILSLPRLPFRHARPGEPQL
jgi:hypothetical protein